MLHRTAFPPIQCPTVSLDDPPASALPTPPSPPVTPQGILILSVALYVASLALPAIRELGVGPSVPPDRGLAVLALGWLGVLAGQFGWLANLFWVIGAYCLSRRHWTAAAITSTIAVLVAADSFRMYATGMAGDSGTPHDIQLLAGFYVWWAGMWVLSAGAWLLLERNRPAIAAD
jgi:hypothetical protein